MWTYKNEPFEEIGEYTGFVYIIYNLEENKKYIGKKLFYFTKSKSVKGKKKRFKTESDWRTYYGSNDQLNEDVKRLGPDKFRREIIRLCKSKGEMTYFEAKYQFGNGVLENPYLWYNSHIMARVHRKHLTYLKNEV